MKSAIHETANGGYMQFHEEAPPQSKLYKQLEAHSGKVAVIIGLALITGGSWAFLRLERRANERSLAELDAKQTLSNAIKNSGIRALGELPPEMLEQAIALSNNVALMQKMIAELPETQRNAINRYQQELVGAHSMNDALTLMQRHMATLTANAVGSQNFTNHPSTRAKQVENVKSYPGPGLE